MSKYESHWVESEALLAVIADDTEYAEGVISGMNRHEAESLLHHIKTLRQLLLDHLQSIPTIPDVIAGLRSMIHDR